MRLTPQEAAELPARVPSWVVVKRGQHNVLLVRKVPSIELSCGYQLQFPEQEGLAEPIRARLRTTSKYQPHQNARECNRRLRRM